MSDCMTESHNLSICESNRKHYDELKQEHAEVQHENLSLKETVFGLKQMIRDSEENTRKQIDLLTQALLDFSNKIPTKEKNKVDDVSIGKTEERIKDNSNVSKENASSINDLDMRLQLHENTTYNGNYLWKIENFQKRQNEAITGKIIALHSAPCFTSQYGYKFCLRVYLNGDGTGKGTHLSLFLIIMKSEHDNILEWPFRKQVKLALLNQQNRANDIVERIVPTEDSSSFQKPQEEMNIGSGCPLFVAIDRLDGEGFVKDDTLFIDVQVV